MPYITVYGYCKSEKDLKILLENGIKVYSCKKNSTGKGIEVRYKDDIFSTFSSMSLNDNEIYKLRSKLSFKENFLTFMKSMEDDEYLFPKGIEEFLNENLEVLDSIKTIDDILWTHNISREDLEVLSLSLCDNNRNIKGIEINEEMVNGGTVIYGEDWSMDYAPLYVKKWINEYKNNKYLQDILNGYYKLEKNFYLDYYDGIVLYLLEDMSFMPFKYQQLLIAGSEYYLINDMIPIARYSGEIEEATPFLWSILDNNCNYGEEEFIKENRKRNFDNIKN